MKRLLCALLVAALCALALSGCDRRPSAGQDSASPEAGANFDPQTTAVAFGGLTQAADEQLSGAEPAVAPEDPAARTVDPAAQTEDPAAAQDVPVDQPVVQDATAPQESAAAQTPEAADGTPAPQPFATATPQPNARVNGYSQVAANGLGFRFDYPTGWTNIPGRSTVCYVQPVGEGTTYPARVAVTMKRLTHRVNRDSKSEHKSELADYVKVLMTQYDEETFVVNTELDETTQFMGNSAISTTYLAYDGDQEIQGYLIETYFDRYLFVFHFLCAYEDYAAFEPAMRHMRDSVQPDQNLLAE